MKSVPRDAWAIKFAKAGWVVVCSEAEDAEAHARMLHGVNDDTVEAFGKVLDLSLIVDMRNALGCI